MTDPAPLVTVRVQPEPFDAAEETRRLTTNADGTPRTDIGALATFTGLVRGDDKLRAMTLEHYPAMTEKALRAIVDEALGRWPLLGATVIHRHGRLTPGEPIVLACTTAAHRGDAFAACEFLMDWLKTEAPFWKKEETEGGTRWVEARTSDDDARGRWKIKQIAK